MTNDSAPGGAFMTNDWRHIGPQSFVIGHHASDAIIYHAQARALTKSDTSPRPSSTLNE